MNNGTQSGLNPARIIQGGVTVQRIVSAIKRFPVGRKDNHAVVAVWDENDSSLQPNTNHDTRSRDSS